MKEKEVNKMKVVKVRIGKDEFNHIYVKDGIEMNRAFIKAFNISKNHEVRAKMKIYKKGRIVMEKIK